MIVAIVLTVVFLPRLAGLMRGVRPAITPPPQDITSPSFNTTGLPLSLPPGFSIEIFAKDLPGARVMLQVGREMYVSQTSEGKITLLTLKDGEVADGEVWLKNLNKPHGLAISGDDLYYAEEDKITRVRLYTSQQPIKIADLPSGGGHFTRTIVFGSDERLYVSIGSSCNICIEKDARRAAIYSMNKDGSDFRSYATGLRNAVFFTWSYIDGRMWATEMGRDWLGDDLPPDEINVIEEGKDYGWPYCYTRNIADPTFAKSFDDCSGKEGNIIDIPAHSAPLGLAFIPEEAPHQSSPGSDGAGYSWPDGYQHDLLVAFHGSWNRSEPTGYKVVRIKLDNEGNYQGTEDFITGWLTPEGALGRPVDLLIQPGGVMYISDDKAGVIYKVTYQGKESEDLVHVDVPVPNSIVQSPLVVRGEARGNWYFEASFPLKLSDANGNKIAEGFAQAQGEWMTEDFVPFEGKLEFAPPITDTGFLILEKDNPSGLPEHAAEIRVPVKFY